MPCGRPCRIIRGIRVAKPSVCLVVASEMTVTAFLLSHMRALSRKYDVSVVANTQNPNFPGQYGLDVRVIPVAVRREIRPVADLRALLALMRIFRREQFDLIHSVTPKAGLLAMLAGWMAGTPVRSHIFTGQVWVTRKGPMRWLLKTMDRLLARAATHLLADSFSQRDFLIREGVVEPKKISVLAKGSISGVDVERFRPDAEARAGVRASLALAEGDLLFMFLGRLNRDKGVPELAQAFSRLPEQCHLALVGPDEEGMAEGIRAWAGDAASRVHLVGPTIEPWRFLAAADVFCLPSHREGFGTSAIEAAACGVPAVATRIYGLTDAVVEGETGLLVPPGDVDALAGAMRRLAEDVELRRRLGEQARERAIRDFSSEQVTRAWMDYYSALL